MRKLAGASCQVPKSYLVGGTFSRLKVGEPVIANGGFSNIREGRYKGMKVAVKTVRTSQESDIKAIHEVSRAIGCPILDE